MIARTYVAYWSIWKKYIVCTCNCYHESFFNVQMYKKSMVFKRMKFWWKKPCKYGVKGRSFYVVKGKSPNFYWKMPYELSLKMSFFSILCLVYTYEQYKLKLQFFHIYWLFPDLFCLNYVHLSFSLCVCLLGC